MTFPQSAVSIGVVAFSFLQMLGHFSQHPIFQNKHHALNPAISPGSREQTPFRLDSLNKEKTPIATVSLSERQRNFSLGELLPVMPLSFKES